MPVRACALAAVLVGSAAAVDSFPVVAVPGPDRVTVTLPMGLPLTLGLAHVALPADEAGRAAALQRLQSLVQGKRVQIVYADGFGMDDRGIGRVQLVAPGGNVNEALVAAGLATFAPATGTANEAVIRSAEMKAKQAKVGVWAAAPVASATPAAKPTTTTAAAAKPRAGAAASGPFCSELDNQYYYPTGAKEIAGVHPQRVIYYPDEATAKKAGKKPKQAAAALPTTQDEPTADALFEQAKGIVAKSSGAPPSDARDQGYEQAYALLTRSMQIYSALAEMRSNDEKLGEKLRACMQMRYGTVKMRRFH
jgi:hypothetical protein